MDIERSGGLIVVALIAFAAFNLWLRQQRRQMIHRERLAALEKGIELPAIPSDARPVAWNVQAILLLAGLCWVAVGLATFVVLSELISNAPPLPSADSTVSFDRVPPSSFIPKGLQSLGVLPLGIGIAHLIVYLSMRRNDRP
jgi:hypothetical protein